MKTKNYILCDSNNRDLRHKFKGKYPYLVARKVASRGIVDIRLRQTGTKRIHIFKGIRKKVEIKGNCIKGRNLRAWVGKAKKLRIEKL